MPADNKVDGGAQRQAASEYGAHPGNGHAGSLGQKKGEDQLARMPELALAEMRYAVRQERCSLGGPIDARRPIEITPALIHINALRGICVSPVTHVIRAR